MTPILKPQFGIMSQLSCFFGWRQKFYFDKKLVRLCIDLVVTTPITRPSVSLYYTP